MQTGGRQNRGLRQNDVAILDLIEDKRDQKMVAAGCRASKIFWKSQMVADDGNTWVTEIMPAGKYSSYKFSWTNYSEDRDGVRTARSIETRWERWASTCKAAIQQHAGVQTMPGFPRATCPTAPLGRYWTDAECNLTPMDVVYAEGQQDPKIVVEITDKGAKVIGTSTEIPVSCVQLTL